VRQTIGPTEEAPNFPRRYPELRRHFNDPEDPVAACGRFCGRSRKAGEKESFPPLVLADQVRDALLWHGVRVGDQERCEVRRIDHRGPPPLLSGAPSARLPLGPRPRRPSEAAARRRFSISLRQKAHCGSS
jgi:hypothetical protein